MTGVVAHSFHGRRSTFLHPHHLRCQPALPTDDRFRCIGAMASGISTSQVGSMAQCFPAGGMHLSHATPSGAQLEHLIIGFPSWA